MRFVRSILAIITIALMSVITITTTVAEALATPVVSYTTYSVANYHSHPVAVTLIKEVRDTVAKTVSRTYTVRSGDYLSGIAEQMYGHAEYWTGIYEANKSHIANPNLIYVGQQLVIPIKPSTANVTISYSSNDNDLISGDSGVAPPSGNGSSGGSTSINGCSDPSGRLTYAQVGMLWLCAGGPAWAEAESESVSECESSHDTYAYNPSGATGLWQILGAVVPGNLYDAHVNALNAVSKFEASGYTWAQWVCKPSAATTASVTITTSSASSSLEYRAMQKALTRIGAPYVWGAAGPWSFDCSGLVVWSYQQLGVYEPHYTGDLWVRGYHVSRSQLRPGDLVFFYSGHSHVGIYLGNGMMVDAPHTGADVQRQPVYWSNFSGAVRL